MIDPTQLHGKRLAMIAWGKKKDGSDDVAVFSGVASWDGSQLSLRRDPPESSFPVPGEWLERIKAVDSDLKETLLGADYCFSVTVGDLSDADDLSKLVKSGLKWPTDEETS